MNKYILIAPLYLLFISCINNECYNSGLSNKNTKYKIEFSGYINSSDSDINNTKSELNYFKYGNRADVYIFSDYNTLYPLNYEPHMGSAYHFGYIDIYPPIYQNKSTVSIYSLSYNNSSNITQRVFHGKFYQLNNNIDYILASQKGLSIFEDTQIALNFKHLCSQIQFSIIGTEEIDNILVKKLYVNLPDIENSYISIKDEKIITSTQTFKNVDLLLENNTSEKYIVIPYLGNISLVIEAQIIQNDGSIIDKRYSGEFTISLQAGISYTVGLKINNSIENTPYPDLTFSISTNQWSNIHNNIIYEKIKNPTNEK